MSGEDRSDARQLVLSLPHEAALGREDFVVSPVNAAAIDTIDRWPAWPERGVLLVGPAGAGKTHLTAIWAERSGAARIEAAKLGREDAPRLAAAGAVAVEDLHAGPVDEAALFHLVNIAGEQHVPLLLTSRQGPGALSLALPDLRSRLRAAQRVELGEPDDDLLRRVMTKLFADRQLTVDAAVIDFILLRMERSLEAANIVADQLDRDALAENRAITKRLAAAALDRLADRQRSLWDEE
ncbi:MAG: hypothetical protein KDJ88_02220 [Bauldia sp.]|nr:hypothetical protein [Bauldia sp.]